MTPQGRRVIVRIEAEADITDAAIWYHNREPGLADDFLADVESAIARRHHRLPRSPRRRR